MNNNFKNVIVSDNINELYKEAILNIENEFDYLSHPRGKHIKERLATQHVLTNPRDCLVTIKERKLNYQFAIIEKFEYLFGKHDPIRLVAYNSNLKNYEGIYNYFDGNYAQRFNYWLDHIYQILKNDPDSRQAVISIYDTTARHQSLDIPCTLNLQFFIRNQELSLITTMRSNDLLWGFPYDVNAFCFLLEVMACWLGVEIGTYIHQVGSMHIYLEPEENHRQLLSCTSSIDVVNQHNPTWNLGYEDTKKYLPLFFAAENMMRTSPMTNEWRILEDQLPPVLQDYLKALSRKWTKIN
jgi:thymidylate synthase